MKKLVDEAPYHPGYEDAVVKPDPVYIGVDPTKMIWKPKPLSDWAYDPVLLARAIEERHGIK